MREDLIKTADATVSAIVLQAGEEAPWHAHIDTTEHLFCLVGSIEVQLQAPERSVYLKPGQRCTVDARRMHRLINPSQNPAQYLIVQNGTQDFADVDIAKAG